MGTTMTRRHHTTPVRHDRTREYKGVRICTSCRAVYYRKAWHHDSQEFRRLRMREGQHVEHVLCAACKMIRTHRYQGKVTIENVPTHFAAELVNLVLSYAKRARKYNPEHRLIEVHKDDHALVLTTTEDQLAVALAKKVRDVFKRVQLNIHYANGLYGSTSVWVRFLEGEMPPRFA